MNDQNNAKVSVGLVVATVLSLGIAAVLLVAQLKQAPQSSSQVVNVPTQSSEPALGGLVHNIQEQFNAGVGVNNVEVVSNAGELTIGGGTKIKKYLSTTVTLNPASIAAGQSSSSLVTFTGVLPGDTIEVGLNGNWASPTSSMRVFAVPGTGTATLYFYDSTSTALDLSEAVYNLEAVRH